MPSDEGSQTQPYSDFQGQGTSEQTSDTTFQSSSTDQHSRVDQRNMDFSPMPSQQFGQLNSAMSPIDMRHMSSALPGYTQQRYVQSQHQPHIPQAPTVDPNLVYSTFPSQQFAGQIASQYASQFQQQQLHAQSRGYSGYNPNINVNTPEIQSHNNIYSPQPHLAYSTNMPQQPQYPSFPAQPSGPYGQLPNLNYQQRMVRPYQVPRVQVDNPPMVATGQQLSQTPQVLRRNSSNSSLQTTSTLRGPPRKPKQSGHALWVGNLPPGTQILDLKDHFARDATEDIESVFLISKSNCAFVNYKSEDSCAAAMTRFHDSRFRGVRLVCRLRRGSNSGTSPASATVQADIKSPPAGNHLGEATNLSPQNPMETVESAFNALSVAPSEKFVKEKFFIVKSLTVEDLDRSVNSGIWATQSHNEENLNLAFATAESVYLIFSANKSGEYFGFARMESQISADAASGKEVEPRQTVSSPAAAPNNNDVPLSIATSATATAPRGHIIDDSARGTIFWEAEAGNLIPGNAVDGIAVDSGDTSGEEIGQKGPSAQQSTFGKPFKISWQSTERLPFYRTRGLRNPWNANREVKIARDGTELEPTVGRKLIAMFEQQAQINLAARTAGPPPQYGYPQQMVQYPGMMPPSQYGYGHQGPSAPYGRPY